MTEDVKRVNGREVVGFWWKACVIEPHFICVPVFRELSKSLEVEDGLGGFKRVPKVGPICRYFTLKSEAVEFVKTTLETRAAEAYELAERADLKRRTFAEEHPDV